MSVTLGSHLRQKDHNNNYGDDDDGNKGEVKKKEKKNNCKKKKKVLTIFAALCIQSRFSSGVADDESVIS